MKVTSDDLTSRANRMNLELVWDDTFAARDAWAALDSMGIGREDVDRFRIGCFKDDEGRECISVPDFTGASLAVVRHIWFYDISTGLVIPGDGGPVPMFQGWYIEDGSAFITVADGPLGAIAATSVSGVGIPSIALGSGGVPELGAALRRSPHPQVKVSTAFADTEEGRFMTEAVDRCVQRVPNAVPGVHYVLEPADHGEAVMVQIPNVGATITGYNHAIKAVYTASGIH